MREFLDASINLEKDISQSKIEELKIRTSIKALFEEKEAKLQEIELSVRNYAKKVEEQSNERFSLNTLISMFWSQIFNFECLKNSTFSPRFLSVK